MGRHLALLALVGLVACHGAAASSGSAQTTADSATKAVYNDDVGSLNDTFDSQLQSQVSRAEVGALSDKMHALGDYKGLTYLSDDPAKSEFTYRADFDKGSMNVVVRIDTDGKLAAYRVFPQT
jgi:hypothetical protein